MIDRRLEYFLRTVSLVILIAYLCLFPYDPDQLSLTLQIFCFVFIQFPEKINKIMNGAELEEDGYNTHTMYFLVWAGYLFIMIKTIWKVW